MNYPLLTEQLAAQIEDCDTDYIARRLRGLAELPGNPYGAEVREFGGATGLMVTGMPGNSLFNKVGGLSGAEVGRLDEIIGWYGEKGLAVRFDLLPGQTSPELLWGLAERGFYQSGFYAALYGPSQIESVEYKGVTTRAVEQAELEQWVEIYLEGHAFPARNHEVLGQSIKTLFGQPGVHFYFGLLNDQPAGVALLINRDGQGYLATAATLPAFRNRGCQKALMQARVQEAARAGCELVVSHTNFASQSQHNMEKVGMRLAYTKAIWTRLK